MKTISLWLLPFLIVTTTCAQSGKIEGTILARSDSTASSKHEPIPYAHVHIKDFETNYFISTVSDTEGRFSIIVPDKYQGDTLRITYVGFERMAIPIQSIENKLNLTVHLKPFTTVLPSVTVRGMTAKELFQKCLTRIRANYLDVSFLNSCFYWQSQKEDGEFTNLAQAHLTIVENNSKVKAERHFRTDTLVTQSPLTHLIFLDSIENTLYFDFLRSGAGVMNPQHLEEWDFSYDHQSVLPENYFIINARRLDNLMEIKLMINENDYAFEQIDYQYTWKKQPHHIINDTLAYSLQSVRGKVLYRRNAEKYNIKYLFGKARYDISQRENRHRNFKKLFTREITHELSVLSSIQKNYSPLIHFGKPVRSFSPVIVNEEEFRGAVIQNSNNH
jgi:hypothetical protein